MSTPPTTSRTGLSLVTVGLVQIYRTEGHDVAALSGVTLSVGAGEFVGLLGPSGSGKSTLLSLCSGLLRPSAGQLLVDGRNLALLTAPELDVLRATELGILLQGASRNLVPYLSCAENVAFAQGAARRHGRDDATLPDPREVLDLVGLPDADRPLAGLPAGHLQLVAIAAAIAHAPGLVLADEPTSQLDDAARDVVLEALTRVNRELGTTVVVVTHDPEVAARIPRTVTIRNGRIGAEGRSGEDFAVVTADGSLPLPPDVLRTVPPGTLLRVVETPRGIELVRVEEGEA
ncbi:ATP-binding cassette domain-containing protein [Nocardioides sp. C4-1]|uniref:ABC transporter ATP-binding protein n=1 Tax=Nocardioides sp. C4-1 TaxID=3151851 RepID=UPI00326324FC